MSGPGGWQVMHSFRRDPSVTDKRLPPGTIKRIARFAAPYKRQVVWFLLLVVVDSVIGAVTPLLYVPIIDNGILKHNQRLVVALAALMAVLAIVSAAVNLANRWFSARI